MSGFTVDPHTLGAVARELRSGRDTLEDLIGRAMGLQVDPETLHAAASQARLAGQSTASANIRHLVDVVTAALPGAASPKTVADFADDWSARLAGWSRNTEEHGEKLDQCATAYIDMDQQGQQNFTVPWATP